MPDANEATVQDALNEVLNNESGAESQSATKSTPEVAEAIKDALKPEGASDDSAEVSTEDGGEKGTKTVPYDRLAQVVRQKNDISERYKNLEEQFKSATSREKDLTTRIGKLEQSAQILDAIKDLAHDERYRDSVVRIDRALQGLDDEIEEAVDNKDNKAEFEALKKFEQKTAELDDLLADQRAEKLWEETYDSAKEMLSALPEEYNDEDRVILGKLWTPRVDWDKIEELGSTAIPGALNESFAKVIKEYGTPRGALIANTTKEVESRIPEDVKKSSLSPEETVKGLLDKDWAELDKEGKPVISDEEFDQSLADVLRAAKHTL